MGGGVNEPSIQYECQDPGQLLYVLAYLYGTNESFPITKHGQAYVGQWLAVK